MIYLANIKDLQEIYSILIPNIQLKYAKSKIFFIEDKQELSKHLEKSNNLTLFNNINLNNPYNNANIHTFYILYNLKFTDTEISLLKKLQGTTVLTKCTTPKTIKLEQLVWATKKININQAKQILSKYVPYNIAIQIAQSLLLPNSDYYIDIKLLTTIIKQLQLVKNNPQLLQNILANIKQFNINQFETLKFFINEPIYKATEFFNNYIKTQNIFSLTSILKSQLKLAYLLKEYSVKEISKELKKNIYSLEKIKKITQMLSKPMLIEILFSLENLETNIKTGRLTEPTQSFLIFLIKIKAKIKRKLI